MTATEPDTAAQVEKLRDLLGLPLISTMFTGRKADTVFAQLGARLIGRDADRTERVWAAYEALRHGPAGYQSDKDI